VDPPGASPVPTDSAAGSDAPVAAAADDVAQSGPDEPVTVGGEPADGGDTEPSDSSPDETVTTVGGEPADDGATPA
jgi:hypothetical protein